MSTRKRRTYRMTPKQFKNVVLGPIRHDSLPAHFLAVCKYTFDRVGKYVVPTFEEWELGFMRDATPDREIFIWLRISIAMDKLQPDDPKATLAQLVAVSTGVPVPGEVGLIWDGITQSDLEKILGEVDLCSD